LVIPFARVAASSSEVYYFPYKTFMASKLSAQTPLMNAFLRFSDIFSFS
jgi:hypothetical protein